MSDIDLVIVPKDEWKFPDPNEVLERFVVSLEKSRGTFPNIKLLSKATVPVIKLESSPELHNIKLDLTVKSATHRGLQCVEIVKEYLKQFPQLQPLLLLLKYMLKLTELNDPYKGGLTSYGLLLMLVAFFKAKTEWPKDVSLGKWLLWVMHFYAKWNAHWTIVYPRVPFAKLSVLDQPVFVQSEYSDVPIIVDPLSQVPPHNVTKTTEKIGEIQDIFFAAVSSVWTECTCSCHQKRKAAGIATAAGFSDRKHKLLARIFEVIQGCHKIHEEFF